MVLGLAGVAFAIILLAARHWTRLNSNDLGSMSRQWLAEYNAHNP
ncbi:MAG TPA: hypothetical protein VFV51_01560 [Vicinamibacterales bacterium]|nr:hypothetical protein [Vicinamibacterales bacterium]